MKIKFRINRRYSFFVTLLACAFSVWMMVRNFGLPVADVYHYALLIVLFLLVILAVAALLAFILRAIANRRAEQ